MRTEANGRPELLSPGGSIEAIEAALSNGADAVYVGVGTLNARARARNLTPIELPGVVAFAHDRGARVHVALNVPARPEDVDEIARTLASAWLAGADAVIARDVSLVMAAREVFPDLAIHVSTQAGVAGPAAARRWRDMGCSRVILAREMSRDAIAATIQEVPGIETEVFVFGALCFAVSGMCLLGHAVSGRSGNYGACSQACRLPFADGAGRPIGYPFSMKDLDLVPHVRELVRLGVSALKVEGRLKPPAWVGCVTRWLRRALDRDPPGLDPDELDAFHRDVSVLFCRPRTAAFFEGASDAAELIDAEFPGHRGLDVGSFSSECRPEGVSVRFRTPVDLNVHDGLMLTVEGPDSREFRPHPIADLRDRHGQRAFRLPAGSEVEVRTSERGRVLAVAIHSSDAVRVEYERGMRMPADVARGEASRPRFRRVELVGSRLAMVMERGRFRHEHVAEVPTSPARNDGLPPTLAARLFGDAECLVEPGLYVNPSDLKRARREALAALESAWDAVHGELSGRVAGLIREREGSFDSTDDELLARGPVAVSRVTGFPHRVVSTGGVRFAVTSGQGGTRVDLAAREARRRREDPP